MANYITKEGMQRLHTRMNELIEMRKVVIKQVVTAREMGDLSENAEYKAARENQKNIENEYNHIKNRISLLQVLDPTAIPKDAVRFGAKVTIENVDTGEIKKHFLVGVDEIYSDGSEYERMSIASPIGKPMIGKKPGDVFIVKAPIGDKKFKIIDIK